MPVDPEDDLDEALAGLPTTLPTEVVGMPGAITSASINAKINAAMAGRDPDVNAIDVVIGATEENGKVRLSGALVVKLGDGWAVYGEGAMVLHGAKSVEVGFRREWRKK